MALPTQLLLEGDNLETLLAQVRDEHGSGAVIVSAERVRTGGVAGFFAKQKYELTVELEDPDGSPNPPPGGAVSPVPAGPDRRAPSHARGSTAAVIASIEELAALADTQEAWVDSRTADSAHPPSFASVLAGERPANTTPEADPPPAPTPPPPIPHTPGRRSASAASLFDSDGIDSSEGADRMDATTPAGVPSADPESPTVRPIRNRNAAPAAQWLSALQPTTEEPVLPPDPGERPARHRPDPARSPAPEEPGPAVSTATFATGSFPGGSIPAAFGDPALEPSVHGVSPAVRSGELVQRLVELGLPEHLAHRASGTDRYAAIVTALSTLPVPPAAPAGPGEVLVIVGELAPALGVARGIAIELRLDPYAIVVAAAPSAANAVAVPGDRRLTTPQDAQRWATRHAASDVPHVVVVDTDGGQPARTRSVVEALGATAVWGAVDATRKTADVARQLNAFGRLDAIATYATGATGDPASALRLGIPVALVDGHRATPYAWAAVLCERLEREATDVPR